MSVPTDRCCRVVLVRHGRTHLNAQGRLRGRLDPGLDECGRREVLPLADALRPLEPRAVISSPLMRARQTAQAIARRYLLPVVSDDRLADRDYGPWAGHLESEVVEQWGSLDAAPGVEPLDAVVTRARAVLDEQRDSPLAGPIVLVSHDAVNRSLLLALGGSTDPAAGLSQRTACWNVIVLEGDLWRVAAVDRRAS